MTDFAFLATCPAEPAGSVRSQRFGAWGEVRPSASGRTSGGTKSGILAGNHIERGGRIGFGQLDIEQCSAGDPGGGAE